MDKPAEPIHVPGEPIHTSPPPSHLLLCAIAAVIANPIMPWVEEERGRAARRSGKGRGHASPAR